MIPKDLYYTEDHEWIRVTEEGLYVGITDYAQEQLGDIVYVELPGEGDDFEKGDAVSVVESVKTASDIFAPVDGEIIKVNEALEDSPELINTDCYENYIFVLDGSKSDVSKLMSAKEYEKYIEGL